MTYAQLSEKSGIPVNTIKSIFCGRSNNPTIETLNAIKQALGFNIEDFDDGLSAPYTRQDEEKVLRMYRSLGEKSKACFMSFAEWLSEHERKQN